MSEEKRAILEMLSDGKITQEQAEALLEALGAGEDSGAEPEAEPTEAEAGQIELTLQPDTVDVNIELPPESPEPTSFPTPPAPPVPPEPPQPGSQEDMERYIRECRENNDRYSREMERYQAEIARYTAQCQAQMDRYARDAERARQHAPSSGDWTSWLAGIGEEIRRGLEEIGRDLGRDLDEAMDDVQEAVSDLKEALGDVVEDWQEELADEQEELQEQLEEAEEMASENPFLITFGPDFPFGGEAPRDAEQVVAPDIKPEFEGGEFIYRKWAGLNKVEHLDIDWPTGQVNVHPWDGDSIEIIESSKKALNQSQQCLMFVQDGEKLTIKEYPQKNSAGGIFGKGWNNLARPSKRLELLIPRSQCGQIEKLKIQCMSGTVQVSELSGEDFKVSAVSGTVTLSSLSVESLDAGTVSGTLVLGGCSAEKLNAHSVSGTNMCKGFSAERAELSTVSGTLNAHGNAEKFKVSTVSGSVSLMVDQCPEKAHMSSVSGSLKLRLPENAGFIADYSSTSGAFRNDFGADIQADSKRKKAGRAIFGNGQCKIDMHTTSGSMSVLKADGQSV